MESSVVLIQVALAGIVTSLGLLAARPAAARLCPATGRDETASATGR